MNIVVFMLCIWCLVSIVLALYGIFNMKATCKNLTIFDNLRYLLAISVAIGIIFLSNLLCNQFCHNDDENTSTFISVLAFVFGITIVALESIIISNVSDDCFSNPSGYKLLLGTMGIIPSVIVFLYGGVSFMSATKHIRILASTKNSQKALREVAKQKQEAEALNKIRLQKQQVELQLQQELKKKAEVEAQGGIEQQERARKLAELKAEVARLKEGKLKPEEQYAIRKKLGLEEKQAQKSLELQAIRAQLERNPTQYEQRYPEYAAKKREADLLERQMQNSGDEGRPAYPSRFTVPPVRYGIGGRPSILDTPDSPDSPHSVDG